MPHPTQRSERQGLVRNGTFTKTSVAFGVGECVRIDTETLHHPEEYPDLT